MTKKEIVDIFKRFLIVFVCCLPMLIVFNIFLNWHRVLIILISCVFVAGVFCLEEYIHFKNLKKRKERREQEKLKKNKNI